MIREEIIAALNVLKQDEGNSIYSVEYGFLSIVDICNEIIKILEKEPCNDAISRQAAQEGLNHLMDSDGFRDSVGYVQKSLVRKMLVNLPPVNPQPKTGHWIPVSNPREELPKDRILWVTIGDDNSLDVTTLYWDMTEWSEGFVDYVLAYMDYIEPSPYKAESEE